MFCLIERSLTFFYFFSYIIHTDTSTCCSTGNCFFFSSALNSYPSTQSNMKVIGLLQVSLSSRLGFSEAPKPSGDARLSFIYFEYLLIYCIYTHRKVYNYILPDANAHARTCAFQKSFFTSLIIFLFYPLPGDNVI